MLVLGIDQSLKHTGVFWFDGEKTVGWQQIDTGMRRGAQRLRFIRDEIIQILDEQEPVLTAIEGYAYGAPGRVFELGEIGGILKVTLEERSFAFITAAPNQVKKFATGHGNADKRDMVKAMNKRFGLSWVEKDNNLADAAALACIARAYLLPEEIKQRDQLEVIASLKKSVTIARQSRLKSPLPRM